MHVHCAAPLLELHNNSSVVGGVSRAREISSPQWSPWDHVFVYQRYRLHRLHYGEVLNCIWKKKYTKIENKSNLELNTQKNPQKTKTHPKHSTTGYLECTVKIPENAVRLASGYSRGPGAKTLHHVVLFCYSACCCVERNYRASFVGLAHKGRHLLGGWY